jgi:oxygen-independent coproporphyrinogen-3 oxidase
MSGLQIAELIDQTAAARLATQGLLKLEGTRVRATPSGLLLLDGVLREIVRV